MRVLIVLALPFLALAFVPHSKSPSVSDRVCLSAGATAVLEPKEMVKVFGRLAEKYIMLDDSGGMCCYSGCSGEKNLVVHWGVWFSPFHRLNTDYLILIAKPSTRRKCLSRL